LELTEDTMRQPWLHPPDTPVPSGVPDDFSPRSTTRAAGGVALAVGIALVVMAAGRSPDILDAAYGLPVVAGTETIIAAAEAWDGALQAIGVPAVVEAVRGVLSAGRG
jgi:hypothetical protein